MAQFKIAHGQTKNLPTALEDGQVYVTYDSNGQNGKIFADVEISGKTVRVALEGEQGPRGKSAYQYAQEGGYQGTEEEFTQLLSGLDSEIENHNQDELAHPDIRNEISQLSSEIEDLKKGEDTSYTNLLPTAVSRLNLTEVLQGDDGSVGYLNKRRWSSTSNNYSSYSLDISGLIPCVAGNTIRLKNVLMYEDASLQHGGLELLNADGEWVANTNLNAFSSSTNAIKDSNNNIIQFTIPDWQTNGEIRYFSITCQDINEKSIITVNEEIPEDEIETRVTDIENTLVELDNRVTTLENATPSGKNTNDVPDYWLTALEEGAEAINTALCEAGSNKSAFLFYSDAHWNSGSQKSPLLLKWLYQNTGINKTYFGGDVVNNEAADYDTMKYLWTWRKLLKEVPNHHSVVGNHDDGNATNNLFSEKYVYGYLFGPEDNNDIVRGADTYYYYDEKSERTRYIFLDTAYKGMHSKQQEFLKQALISTPDNWHIVVIAHIWYGPDYDNYNVRPIPIVGLSNDAKIVTGILDAYNSRTGDYENCGGWVEFCIGGHVHRDYDNTTPGGIPIILVETDSANVRGNYTYTQGTTSESSVNGIIADYDNCKISVIRIGRGTSREVALQSREGGYTNILPYATTNDGTTIYNGVGWKPNVRWSGSNNIEQQADGIYLTGYIQIKQYDVISLADIMMPNEDSFKCKIYAFTSLTDTSENTLGNSTLTKYQEAIWDENGNLQQITINDATWNFIRIQCGGITEASIITINESIE